MQLNNKCIQCGTTENLNAFMKVSVENVMYEVALCNKHAEGMTPKKVGILVAKKIKEFNALVADLQGFGYNISPSSGQGNVIQVVEEVKEQVTQEEQTSTQAQQVQPQPTQPQQKTEKKVKVLFSKGGKTVNEPVVVGSKLPSIKSAGGNVGGESVQGYQSLRVDDAVRDVAQKAASRGGSGVVPSSVITETQTVVSKTGAKMVLPKSIKDNFGGQTTINVIDSGGDKVIQDRMKALNYDTNKANKYTVSECTVCRGTGIGIDKNPCRKCGGTGMFDKTLMRSI